MKGNRGSALLHTVLVLCLMTSFGMALLAWAQRLLVVSLKAHRAQPQQAQYLGRAP